MKRLALVAAAVVVCLGCGGPSPGTATQTIDPTLEGTYIISWPPLAPGACAASTNNISAALADTLWCTHPNLPQHLHTSCRMVWDGWVTFDLCNHGVNVEPPAARTFKAVRQGGPGSCYTDIDCPQSSGYICEAGTCVEGCRGDQYCRPDMYCDLTIPPYGGCVLR